MNIKITRRDFLIGGITAVGSYAGLNFFQPGVEPKYTLGYRGPNRIVGHLLRNPHFTSPSSEQRTKVAIVGGGIAGLSAARKLEQLGIKDYLLIELESEVGGNSKSWVNATSGYPLGAHYIPLPTAELEHVFDLFEELKVIEGYSAEGQPNYNELFLCHAPAERLFVDGTWQEGLIPERNASERDRAQFKNFIAEMNGHRTKRDSSGKRAFALPVDKSSQSSEFLSLDRLTMADYLVSRGYDSPRLNWYVDYCCRDDFGTGIKEISAWAGIHYFAARGGTAANAELGSVLTWPEGNGWIVNQMKARLNSRIMKNALVYSISQASGDYCIDFYNIQTRLSQRVRSEAVIYAGPRFVGARIIEGLRESPPNYLKEFTYAPWLVTNLTLRKNLKTDGLAMAWDNVAYGAQSLGYVDATHQNIRVYPSKKVLTHYWPLSHLPPKEARKELETKSDEEWALAVLYELERMHPDIRSKVESIELCPWAHGMIRPTPGFIWGKARQEALKPLGNLYFAHSDMSGMSLFEEAQYRGIVAAIQVAKVFGMSRV